jgi:hypothetical protein
MQTLLNVYPTAGLPAATLPLTGSELVQLVQGGIPVQTALSNLANPTAVSYTSTQVLNLFQPVSAYSGRAFTTTDMGVLQSDGNGWRVQGTPPIPPGALALSYNHAAFVWFPSLADVTAGVGQVNGAAPIYPGYISLTTATIGSFSTASNGQLLMSYTGTAGQNAIFTIVPYHSAHLASDYGTLALQQGKNGFYVEMAATESTNNSDTFDTLFVEPQEHNPLQDDSNPAFCAKWEAWHEDDIWEDGHGTDQGGAYRGAYLKWSGHYQWANTFTSAPATGSWTGSTLSSAWCGETGAYTIYLSTAQQITGNFTNGSTAVTGTATITGSPTASFTTSYNHIVNNVNVNTTSIDNTVEHVYGGAYDPIGQTLTIYLDGVQEAQLSTYFAASPDTYRDTLHYMIVVATQSHGTHVVHTMTVRYVAMWIP